MKIVNTLSSLFLILNIVVYVYLWIGTQQNHRSKDDSGSFGLPENGIYLNSDGSIHLIKVNNNIQLQDLLSKLSKDNSKEKIITIITHPHTPKEVYENIFQNIAEKDFVIESKPWPK